MFHRIVLMIYVYLMYASSAIVVRLTAKKNTTQSRTRSLQRINQLNLINHFKDCCTPAGIIQTLGKLCQPTSNLMLTLVGQCNSDALYQTHTHTNPYTRNDRLRFQSKRIVRLTWSKTAIIESIRYMHELKPIEQHRNHRLK